MSRQMASPVSKQRRSRWGSLRVGTYADLRSSWNPLLYTGVLMGFLLGRALPGNPMVPFGIAYYAAIRGAGVSSINSILIAIAVAFGCATTIPSSGFGWATLAVLFCHVVADKLRIGTNRVSPLSAALLAMTAALILAVASIKALTIIEVLFWLIFSGILALVFTYGIANTVSGAVDQADPADYSVPAVIILSAALCGLEGISISNTVPLREVITGFVVLTYAYFGGTASGTVAASILGAGFLFAVFGGQSSLSDTFMEMKTTIAPAQTMAYVVAGLLAGVLRGMGKAGTSTAFMLGLITCSMVTISSPHDLLAISYSGITSALLFWITPKGISLALLPVFSPARSSNSEQGGTAHGDSYAIAERLLGMSQALREVSNTFEQAAMTEARQESELELVIRHIDARVCKSCSMYRHCWEANYTQTQSLLVNLWNSAGTEEGMLMQLIPENLAQHCIYPSQLASTLAHFYELNRSRYEWERRVAEGRVLAGDYVKNVAHMLEKVAGEARWPTRSDTLQRLSGLCVTFGSAKIPKRGGHISGDSYIGALLQNGRYLMILSDGMGGGRNAALESKQCVKLLQKMLDAGFSTEMAVRTVNSVFLLRSPDETFATVDLCIFDLCAGQAEFVKVGASPSFIKRGPDVTMVRVASVPVGIISQVQIEPEFRILHPGDIVVMISDGIWDVSRDDKNKERWLLNHLRRQTSTDPEEIAESILAQALEATDHAEDDMTVLVARIDTNGGALSNTGKSSGGATWVPARAVSRSEKPANSSV